MGGGAKGFFLALAVYKTNKEKTSTIKQHTPASLRKQTLLRNKHIHPEENIPYYVINICLLKKFLGKVSGLGFEGVGPCRTSWGITTDTPSSRLTLYAKGWLFVTIS